MSNIILEIVDDELLWDYVFKNMLQWEHQNFPKGSWISGHEVREFIRLQKLNRYHVILAWSENKKKERELAGFLSWWHDRKDVCYINEVFVIPKFKGLHIATNLLRMTLPIIQEDQKSAANILVIEDNWPMLHIQEKLMNDGWYQDKRYSYSVDYYGNGKKLRYIKYRGVNDKFFKK